MPATLGTPAPDADGKLTEKLAGASLANQDALAASKNGNGNDAAADDDDDDDAEDGEDGDAAAGGDGAAKKKKKKGKKSGAAKKKAKALKEKQANGIGLTQTSPEPTLGLSKIWPSGDYPEGENCPYDEEKFTDDTRSRRTPEELRERERLAQEGEGNSFSHIRKAAEVHRQVRKYARGAIQPGMSMTEIANLIEDKVRLLSEHDPENPFKAGMGFPTGLSLNECAAHYTPNAGDKRILQKSDVLKVDIGVQCNGRICDSAFTLNFEPTHDPLLEAVKAATAEGVKQAGIDSILGEIGASIQEVMESHEYDYNGKTHQVKCVQNLNGHNIQHYSIHGDKSVPIVAMPNLKTRMEEGEYFAIETFGSTGKGYVVDSGDCSHYARSKHVSANPTLRVASARPLLHAINKNFGTLPFCRRYLDRVGEKNYLLGLKHLVSQGIVQDYPPLSDIAGVGAYTAQFEHTILLKPTGKEIVSKGEDY
ncbi:peptidase M24A, methionine aminopeptidase [Jaminaea rosea]|uniref:Methionine aminopeptidase 2 n=1 Tax=Jaminaea rosea TaxID=1569628 RepID=A0A316UL18_9BASI|nr:peptidase M24A, methionine aminopeptidase [Jaminaea rosea]PWN25976.1 peptidase M24A, methionine aminopeptidase [Jaminaea rosea]